MRLYDLICELLPFNVKYEVEITGLTQDSRQVQKGDLFCAYPGLHTDGRNYIAQAIDKGAVAILMEPIEYNELQSRYTHIPIIMIPQLQSQLSAIAARFYGYPSHNMTLIGVTGTNGKTSCTHFIAQCLAYTGHSCGVIGSMSNGIYHADGTYESLEKNAYHLTTPDAISLQRILYVLKKRDIHTVALEASSHGIAQGRLNALQFSIAAFTNLSHDHLDYHATMEAYAATKRRLFEWPQLQYAVLNQDDAYSARWKETLAPHITTYTYGIGMTASNTQFLNHCSAHAIQHKTLGLSATIKSPWGEIVFNNQNLFGAFNLSNILLVITVLGILDIPLADITSAIHQLRPIKGRMEKLKGKPMVIIDYAHTPDALQRTLESITVESGELWCIFGCGGNRDRSKRPLMGAIAERYAHHVIITEDNPRYEDPQNIIKEIYSGLTQPEKAMIFQARKEAIQYAIQNAKPDDVILIAGKGHETYQMIKNEKIPFSDHEIAEETLASG
jgi:UDP-N-acetylmuramoyl-L-alanyl-D-glutamate--2,6-diaminopimelate ligase